MKRMVQIKNNFADLSLLTKIKDFFYFSLAPTAQRKMGFFFDFMVKKN